MNYHNKYNKDLNEETEKNFTLPQNNDTMKLQKGVTKLGNAVKKNSPEIKTTVPKTQGDHSTVLLLKYIITQ